MLRLLLPADSVRHRALTCAIAALAALAMATGCMPLPAQNSNVGVSTGRLSDQWVVQWDPVNRTPITMTNRSLQDESSQGEPISDEAAEAAVRGVFHEYRDWFRLRNGVDDIRVVRS